MLPQAVQGSHMTVPDGEGATLWHLRLPAASLNRRSQLRNFLLPHNTLIHSNTRIYQLRPSSRLNKV